MRDKLTQFNTISDAVQLIKSSNRIVILTGAGISTCMFVINRSSFKIVNDKVSRVGFLISDLATDCTRRLKIAVIMTLMTRSKCELIFDLFRPQSLKLMSATGLISIISKRIQRVCLDSDTKMCLLLTSFAISVF